MAPTDVEIRSAEKRMQRRLKRQPRAASAGYEKRTERIVVSLSSGLELHVPPDLVQGLAGASATDLADIEVSPTGLGLHWPRLDADLYLPALLEGLFGTRRWMARTLGKSGGRSKSLAKQEAARTNGKLGGRPRKSAPA